VSDIFIWLAAGAFIGWNFPQPFWATYIQSKVKDFFSKSVE
jgi:hypothetical protein